MKRLYLAPILCLQLLSTTCATEKVNDLKFNPWGQVESGNSAIAIFLGSRFEDAGSKIIKRVGVIAGSEKVDNIAWNKAAYAAKLYSVKPGVYKIGAVGLGDLIEVTAEPDKIHYIGFLGDPIAKKIGIKNFLVWSGVRGAYSRKLGFDDWNALVGKGQVRFIKDTKHLNFIDNVLTLQYLPDWPMPSKPVPQNPEEPKPTKEE